MPTLGELTDLDCGCILIYGPRRSGKTFLCSAFLQRWYEKNLHYRFFSPQQPITTWGRWGGSPRADSVAQRIRGYRHVLIDEPERNFPIDPFRSLFPPGGLLVFASSDPEGWMIGQANWIIHPSTDGNYSFEMGRPFPEPPKPRISIWDRLSADDWCI